MVLVDTSVWIDFFRGTSSPHRRKLHELIEEKEALAVCGVILQEILQGIRSDLLHRQIRNHFKDFSYLGLDEPVIFEKAAEIYRNCRKRGYTICKPIDCLIAAIAIEARAVLLQKDRDFIAIAKCSSLVLYEI